MIPSAERLVQMLRAIALGANDASSAEEAFRIALEEVCEAADWPVGHVYAAGPGPPPRLDDIGTWVLADDPGYDSFRRALAGSGASPREGPARRALAGREVAWSEDVGSAAAHAGLRAACAVPVFVGGDVVAVLEFFLDRADPQEPLLLEGLDAAGVILGRVVERARAEDALRRVRDELTGRIEALERGTGAAPQAQPLQDPDTGLYSPSFLEESLRIELVRAARARRAVAIICLGVDRIDAVEAAGGAAAVEEVMAGLAELLRARVRDGDVASRIGHDFVVILPGVAAGMGRVRAGMLRKAAEALKIPGIKGTDALTASAGFAIFPEHGKTHDALLQAALDALHKGSAAGESRLEMAAAPRPAAARTARTRP